MNIDEITQTAQQLLGDKKQLTIQDLRNIFGIDGSIQDRTVFNPALEYLKAQILSQFSLEDILTPNCYSSLDQMIHTSEYCYSYKKELLVNLSSKIESFSPEYTIFEPESVKDVFVENTLGILNSDDLTECKSYLYGVPSKLSNVVTEELTRHSYEITTNPLKKLYGKFLQYISQKKNLIESPFISKARQLVREQIQNTPKVYYAQLERYLYAYFNKNTDQYAENQSILALSHLSLNSFQKKPEQLSIIDEAYVARFILSPYLSSHTMEQNYRDHAVYMGDYEAPNHIIILDEIQKLQARYDTIAKCPSTTDLQYTEECANIFADFILLQPFNDGNKRTGLYILNQMFLARNIIPPILSLPTNEDLSLALFDSIDKSTHSEFTKLIVEATQKLNPHLAPNDSSKPNINLPHLHAAPQITLDEK